MIRLLAALLLLPLPAAAETCRFAGTTSQGGHLAVQVDARQQDDELTLDITVDVAIHAWMTDYRYLAQELTTWSATTANDPAPRSIAINQRNLADGTARKQQWDVFTRNGSRLEAFRIQGKRPQDLQDRHPALAPHWPPTSFARPWLPDFARAAAERRPDLDLPATDARTPLAFAFYWSRFLPPAGGSAPLVLPGFKRDNQVLLDLAPATPGNGWTRWSTPLRHPALQTRLDSLAAAWVSPDHHLLQLALDVHTTWAAGQATLHAEGCQGVQIVPPR